MNDEEKEAHRRKLNNFCFVCGRFTPKIHKRRLNKDSAMFRDAIQCYNYYFSTTTVEEMQQADFAPEFTCLTCIEALHGWWNKKRFSLPFGLPMAWTDPGEHDPENCYACFNNPIGLNRQSKCALQNENVHNTKLYKFVQTDRSGFTYRGVASAHIPVPHSDALPVPMHPSSNQFCASNYGDQSVQTPSPPADSDYVPPSGFALPSLISQEHLDRIIRKLNLSHNNAMALASELNNAHVLAPGVKITAYKHRQDPYMPFFLLSDCATYVKTLMV